MEILIVIVFLAALVAGICWWFSLPAERKRKLLAGQAAVVPCPDPGTVSPDVICPHCQTKGRVRLKHVERQRNLSGKDIGVAATFGAGVLLFAKGETVTQLHCDNCGVTWRVG